MVGHWWSIIMVSWQVMEKLLKERQRICCILGSSKGKRANHSGEHRTQKWKLTPPPSEGPVPNSVPQWRMAALWYRLAFIGTLLGIPGKEMDQKGLICYGCLCADSPGDLRYFLSWSAFLRPVFHLKVHNLLLLHETDSLPLSLNIQDCWHCFPEFSAWDATGDLEYLDMQWAFSLEKI